jgi:hypothetical protein
MHTLLNLNAISGALDVWKVICNFHIVFLSGSQIMGSFALTKVWETCTEGYYHFDLGLVLLILNTTLPTGVVEPIGADFEFSSKLE